MKTTKNYLATQFLIISASFVSICMKLFFLPEKYFYDSEKILKIMNGYQIGDKPFYFTANIYKAINLFNFSNIAQWSIILSIIGTLTILFISSKKYYTKRETFFLIAVTALLNIFVFNLSKDFIQYLIYSIAFIIISKTHYKNNTKVLLITILFLMEYMVFRTYYIVVLAQFLTIYMISKFYRANSHNKKYIRKLLFFSIILFFLEIFIISLSSTENYTSIISARTKSNLGRINSIDAQTMIRDPFGINTNYFIFMANYTVNFVRILLPVELLVKGIKYMPFIFFQIYVVYIIAKEAKNISTKKIPYLCIVLSFIFTSVIFEPDFGSVVRHEVALYPVYYGLIRKESDEES